MLVIKPKLSVTEMKAEEIRAAENAAAIAQTEFTAILTDTLLEEEEEEEINEQDI